MDPIFREALFLASPELLVQIKKWEAGYINDAQKIKRLQITILKYYTRISTRCTPFGLFSSCELGGFDSKTEIELGSLNDYKRITRFDTTFLNSLFHQLLKEENIRENILFYPNTSIYKIGDHYRYVEYTIKNEKRLYSLEGVQYSTYIELILKEAKRGKKISELVELIIDEEVTFIEAKEFINELIENQILVSELEITVTGSDYLSKLIKKIDSLSDKYNYRLQEIKNSLEFLDCRFSTSIEKYNEITDKAKFLLPNFNHKYLFQVDSFSSSCKNRLNNSCKKDLSEALIIYNKISIDFANSKLENFKNRFLNRYESQLLPLNIVLDTEVGIGYGNKKTSNTSLLDGITLGKNYNRYEEIIWSDIDGILQEKLNSALLNNDKIIKLSKKDFEGLPIKWDDIPDTFSSIIEVYGNDTFFIKSIGGASATNLLGRFGNKNNDFSKFLKEIGKVEQQINKDKIIAEIIHLPEARTGNVLHRPEIYDYEIPYLGKSNVDKEKQIPIDDIFIRVRNDEIVLYSKKLKKEIIPRLSNAHNFEHSSLPIYQFLCDLQTQGKRNRIGFCWNPIFSKSIFLPRVEFQNVIFSKARWNIKTEVLKNMVKEKDMMFLIEKWKKDLRLPDYVQLIYGDNKLLIYLKNKTSIIMLYETVKKAKFFSVEEFLFTDSGVVKKGDKSYCNEFVVLFYNKVKQSKYEA
ncbi:lantibiotic dehydratase family protein [uncultured Tenacibaculum sp.]|uniref:lantibiotic dehydratase family protein n=1 Tax=uncultured Tenacibaculum sp. TaxID=174713 RepID=UPI0026122BC5|nr:lantibiotic dehydratase family protein [uncultured Tenacibaculum sp.]